MTRMCFNVIQNTLHKEHISTPTSQFSTDAFTFYARFCFVIMCMCNLAWKGHPQNDLYCVGRDVKPYSPILLLWVAPSSVVLAVIT